MYFDLLCDKGSYWNTCSRFCLFNSPGVACNYLSAGDDPNCVDWNFTDLDVDGSRTIQNFVTIHFSGSQKDRKEDRLASALMSMHKCCEQGVDKFIQ